MGIRKMLSRFRFLFYERIDSEIRKNKLLKIRNNPNVILDGWVTIHPTATIESRKGGTIRIGSGTEIHDGVCLLGYGGNIGIGQGCNINPYTVIYGVAETVIGNNVLIAGHCMIIPTNHVYNNTHMLIKDQGIVSKGIIIEDDVWIAHACTILDGVKIGKGAVIAAGSVVSKDVPPYTVYGGVPARFLKNRGYAP